MRHSFKLLAGAAMLAALTQVAMAETNAYSGAVASAEFFQFIEQHSGDVVKLDAQGDVPADQIEKTDDVVFFWQSNVQVGVLADLVQDQKVALSGCYRIRLADARAGMTAYLLDLSEDCE
jgi:hypothetical protein